MILRRYGGLSLLALACAAGSYLATYAVQDARRAPRGPQITPRTHCMTGWLDLTPQQASELREVEAAFAADRSKLEEKLAAERSRLAALLEDANSSDDDILRQVEAVIAAHDELERRTARHLLALRPYLTVEQTQRLFHRLADGVRECQGWGHRHGQDPTTGRPGQGPPPGRGWRRGYGPDPRGTFDDGLKSTTSSAPSEKE